MTTTQAQVKEFDPAQIRVKLGDRVKITYKNESGVHNFTIREFNVATKTIQNEGQDAVEFIADKPGTFEYFCSVDTHKDKGMVGNLIVE